MYLSKKRLSTSFHIKVFIFCLKHNKSSAVEEYDCTLM